LLWIDKARTIDGGSFFFPGYRKSVLPTKPSRLGKKVIPKAYYQAFFWVLIDLIVELLGLIIKPFDNQTES
jgi:hypothetical protein